MDVRIVDLPEITVIGKMGKNTREKNVVQELWAQANAHFGEIAPLAMKDPDGSFTGFWGAMSDNDMKFLPWTDGFTTGLYLAGAEVNAGAEAPEGWTGWILPARRYLVADVPEGTYGAVFSEVIGKVIPEKGFRLSGAVCDFTEPKTGKNMLFFPVEDAAANG